MNLHLDKKLFKEMIDTLNTRTQIAVDILEKDYYVCMILEELSKNQNELKAYFKGGTAIYKILNQMNRFSEDIDLTVKVLSNESNTHNKNRLEKSAYGYKIDCLELIKPECINNKGSITSIYSYTSVFEIENMPLHKAGKIQVEATSFTVSEPTKKYSIEPLIFKLANEVEKRILKEKYNVKEISIEIIKLERMFIDKIFATEFYYIRNKYMDTSKHLYDIAVLFKEIDIKNLLENKDELQKLIEYKREEEILRSGGIEEDIEITNFKYFQQKFDNDLLKKFLSMQDKYVLNLNYRISIDELKSTLSEIIKYF